MSRLLTILLFISVLNTNATAQDWFNDDYDATWVVTDSLNKYYDYLWRLFIDCYDSMNCVVATTVGNWSPVFFVTTNGGDSWEKSWAYTTQDWKQFQLYSVSYPCPGLIAASSDSGEVLLSKNGGYDVDIVKIGGDDKILGIKMNDENFGAAYSIHSLYITSDGWNTRDSLHITDIGDSLIFINDIDVVEDAVMVNSKKSRIINNETIDVYILAISYDRGATWTLRELDFHTILIEFISKDKGWIYGGEETEIPLLYSSTIFKTTDGGITWDKQLDSLVDGSAIIRGIKFYDENLGIVAKHKNIIATSDGGDNWHILVNREKSCPLYTLSDFSIPGPNNPILVSDNNNIIRFKGSINAINDDEPFEEGKAAYPNPARDAVVIPLGRVCADAEVRAYDCLGRSAGELQWRPGRHYDELIIDTSEQPPGLWLLRVKAGREVFTRKVVKAE